MRLVNRTLPAAPPAPAAPEEPEPDDDPSLENPLGPAPDGPQARWRQAVEAVRGALPRLGKSLSFGRLVSLAGGEARLAFGAEHSFHRATVFSQARAEIEKVLAPVLGPTRVVEEKSAQAWAQAPRSISEVESDDRQARERTIEGRVRSHTAVQSILRVLGGSVEHVQVLDEAPATPEALPPPPDDDA